VRLDGNLVRLTPTEYNLLQHLAKNAGKLVTHRELLAKLWGKEYVDATDYLNVHILHLRRKLADDPANSSVIATERGVGYKFIA
jgi:two-component system KDP operon response regulator KdpE